MIDREKVNTGANMAGNAEKRKMSFDMFLSQYWIFSHEKEETRIYYACLFGYYQDLIFILFNPIP